MSEPVEQTKCLMTGEPCGTATEAIWKKCPCVNCEVWRGHDAVSVPQRTPCNGLYFVAEEFMGGDDWMNAASAERRADEWNQRMKLGKYRELPTTNCEPAPQPPYPFHEVVDSGESVKFDMDGDKWCATRVSFVNLMESIAGFGDTPMQALANLIFNEGVELMEQNATNEPVSQGKDEQPTSLSAEQTWLSQWAETHSLASVENVADALAAYSAHQSAEVTRLQRARVADSEIIGREKCRADNNAIEAQKHLLARQSAESESAALREQLAEARKDYEHNMVIKDCSQCHGSVDIIDSESGGFPAKCHCYQVRCNELRKRAESAEASLATAQQEIEKLRTIQKSAKKLLALFKQGHQPSFEMLETLETLIVGYELTAALQPVPKAECQECIARNATKEIVCDCCGNVLISSDGYFAEGHAKNCALAEAELTPVSAFDLTNEVCRDLPEGWMITICMENGAGWVEMTEPDGNYADAEEFNTYEGIVADVRKALEYAKGKVERKP